MLSGVEHDFLNVRVVWNVFLLQEWCWCLILYECDSDANNQLELRVPKVQFSIKVFFVSLCLGCLGGKELKLLSHLYPLFIII